MGKQDWFDMGAKIGDLVQSAIDSNDFKQLNQSITNTINTTVDTMQKSMDNVQKTMSNAQNTMNDAQKKREKMAGAGNGAQTAGSSVQKKNKNAAWQSGGTAYEQARAKAGMKPDADLPAVAKVPSNYKGVLLTSLGFSFMGVFLIMFLIFSIVSSVTGLFGSTPWIMLVLAAGCGGLGGWGTTLLGQSRRLKQYLRIMGARDTCTIKELAAGSGKNEKYVRKDLKEMIQNRMFTGGAYLDAGETCLMTSHTAYQQYLTALKQFEQRKVVEDQKQQQKQAQEKAEASLSKECQDILKEGKDFIAHIHACNEAIPDETISGKLDRLETVVTKIFDQVAKQPDSAPDLHKMMSYYLPVTRKLVDAYQQLNDQPVAGQNIAKTKKEIEDSLDTINSAFENLLDRFFQDTAWDISSDISVLHTMMAQDGLMKRDFAMGDNKKKTEEENKNE